ncbi:hypothetical protein CHUAL_013737 [Chamberlinius hualienensis]
MLKRCCLILIFLIYYNTFSEAVEQPQNEDLISERNYLLIQRAIDRVKAGDETSKRTLSRIKKSIHEIVKRNTVHLSTECYNDLILFLETLEKPSKDGKSYNWAQQMMDSYGGIPSGIAQANIYWLGDFWECLKVEVKKDNSTELRFKGQYCLAFLNIIVPLPVKIGTCFPSTCTSSELQDVINLVMIFPSSMSLHPDYCQTSDKKSWDAITVVISVFIGFIVCIVIIATIYDSFLTKFKGVYSQQPNVGKFASVLLAFSAAKNCEKVFNLSKTNDGFAAIHGLRAISISWIVLGHALLVLYSFIPFRNMLIIMDIVQLYRIQPLLSVEFAVDTFFCITGFLGAYGLLEHFSNNRKFNYPVYVLHRIFRLSPAYYVFLAFMCGPYAYMGQSPVFVALREDQRVCRERWWQNVFYINIYFDQKEKCLPQAWYLCLDIVYYIVLYPLIVYPLHKKPTLGKINFLIIFITSMIIPAALIYQYDLGAYPSNNVTQEQRDNYMNMVYNKPWGRMTTVLIGMAFGYLMHIKGRGVKINLLLVWILWLISAAIDLALVYGMQPYMAGKVMEDNMQVVFGSLSRPAWGFTIGWIIFSCATGYGGLINKILSWKAFIPISRLAYTIYIVHFTIIGIYYGGRPDGTYIDIGSVTYICTSIIILSIVCALVLNLTTEAPFINLEKIVFKLPSTTSSATRNDHNRDGYAPLLEKSE